MHYFAKKAFQEVMVSATVSDGLLKIFVVSDRLESLAAKLILELLNFSNGLKWQEEKQIKINANSSVSYFEKNIEQIIKEENKKEIFLSVCIISQGKMLSQNILYFLPVKELNLPDVKINKKISEISNGYDIILTSKKLAKNVYLNID